MQAARASRPGALAVFHSLQHGTSTFTLEQMHKQAERLARGFSRLGLGKGDVLAIQLPNTLENAIAHLAAARLGIVVLPIVSIYGAKELNFILEDAGARALVLSGTTDAHRTARLLSSLECADVEHFIICGQTPNQTGISRLEELLEGEGDIPDPAKVNPSDIALILYTSGTTSLPKGVLHSHESLLAEFFAQTDQGKDQVGIVLSPWPPGHIAGTIGLLGHSLLGRDSVIMQRWDANAAAQLIENYRVEQTSGTPLHLMGILDAASTGGYDLSSLKRFITGATTVPETIVAAAIARDISAVRSYGSTEFPTATQSNTDDPLEKRLKTDGRPMPGCDIRIVDEDLNDLPIGSDGEILIRGPERAISYTDPFRTAEAFLDDGWFRTGDIGRLDAEGFMTVTDRKKDIIIRGGENISSLEVEDLILQIPGVQEVAAIAAPHERLGETVCAVIVTQSGQSISLDMIDRHFRSLGVARQKTPELLILRDALPRSPTGKVLKTELRAQVRADLKDDG